MHYNTKYSWGGPSYFWKLMIFFITVSSLIYLVVRVAKVLSVGGLAKNEIQLVKVYADKSEGDVAILEDATGRSSSVDIFLCP